MRRSGYTCCVLATFRASSQADAAYVPPMRDVRVRKARSKPPARSRIFSVDPYAANQSSDQ
jgi:hypothetical protein